MNKTVATRLLACLPIALSLAGCGKPGEVSASETAVPPATDPATASALPDAGVPATIGDDYPAARDACLEAVAKETGIEQAELTATEVLWAEAGVGVTVRVPGAGAPWSCLSDEKGHVQGAAYTGPEGK